jgi:putative ABC transport system permease protein
MRSAISVFAVAIEVVMILSIVAIFMGMLDDQRDRTNGIGADMVVSPSSASFVNGVGGAPMSVKLVDVFRRMPHIAVASPVITDFAMSGNIEVLYGIEYASYSALKPFVFLEGGPFTGPDDAIVDDVFARTGHKVGDTILILNHPFRISGIVESGKGGRKLVPIQTLARLMESDGKTSVIYLKSDDPANEDLIRNEIHSTRGLERYQVRTMSDLISLYTPARFPAFMPALNTVISIAFIVGFLVIFQSMYTAVLERTREIGILKSLGSSKMAIVGVVLRETGVLSLAGVLVGILATFCVRAFMTSHFPLLNFELTAPWIWRGTLIALLGSLLGSLYPAWMAARKDPIDALAYE